MASATLTTKDHANADVVFTLIGVTSKGAIYKDVARSLALPLTLELAYTIGEPGAKANDKLSMIVRDTVQNSGSGVISTCSVKMEASVPRDSAWASGKTENLINYVAFLLGGSSMVANRAALADGSSL